jgi:hypothetical protein
MSSTSRFDSFLHSWKQLELSWQRLERPDLNACAWNSVLWGLLSVECIGFDRSSVPVGVACANELQFVFTCFRRAIAPPMWLNGLFISLHIVM